MGKFQHITTTTTVTTTAPSRRIPKIDSSKINKTFIRKRDITSKTNTLDTLLPKIPRTDTNDDEVQIIASVKKISKQALIQDDNCSNDDVNVEPMN